MYGTARIGAQWKDQPQKQFELIKVSFRKAYTPHSVAGRHYERGKSNGTSRFL
jgi:hypothetical protein